MDQKSVTRFSQHISVTVKKILRKSQALFREKLSKFRLKQTDSFLIKTRRSKLEIFTSKILKSKVKSWPPWFNAQTIACISDADGECFCT